MMRSLQPAAAVLLAALALLAGCRSTPDAPPVQDAGAALAAMIAAHGGAEKIARFRSFRIASEGTFKGEVPFRREVHYRDDDHWSMSIDFGEGMMRAGVWESRCWTEERSVGAECKPGEREQIVLMALRHNAWVLDRIDPATVAAADSIGGLQAIRSGEMTLAFDPQSHRLAQIRHGERAEILSDYRDVGGVAIAAHRELEIDGEHDLEETWIEIEPGVADLQVVEPPPLPSHGMITEIADPQRLVAWTELDEAPADLDAAVDRLDEFVRSRGRKISFADGILWRLPLDAERPWRIAIGVEAGGELAPLALGGFHLEVWPPQRLLVLYHDGDLASALQQRDRLHEELERRGLEPAPAARWQIRAPRSAAEGKWGLVQLGIPVRARK